MAKLPPKKKKKATAGASKSAERRKKFEPSEMDAGISDEDETREIIVSSKAAPPITRSDPEFLAEPERYPELAPKEPEPGTSEGVLVSVPTEDILADSYIGKPYPKPQNIPGPRHPDAPHIEDCRGEYETETHYIYLIKPECYEMIGRKKIIIPKSEG